MGDTPENSGLTYSKTETTVREYDKEGELVTETVIIVMRATPKADKQASPGAYL